MVIVISVDIHLLKFGSINMQTQNSIIRCEIPKCRVKNTFTSTCNKEQKNTHIRVESRKYMHDMKQKIRMDAIVDICEEFMEAYLWNACTSGGWSIISVFQQGQLGGKMNIKWEE